MIDSRLSPEEHRMVSEDLQSLFPPNSKPPPRFRVVPAALLSNSDDLPQITALALHHLRLKNVNMALFDFPAHGLVNLHLYLREVCFSGFAAPARERLKLLVQRMGGIYTRRLTKSTHFLVSKDYVSGRTQWARDHGVPVMTDRWLEDLVNASELLEKEAYRLSAKLANVKLAVSSFSKVETNGLIELVRLNGGTMTESLLTGTDFLIVPENHRQTAKIRKAVRLGIPITTPEYLWRFVEGGSERLEVVYDPLIVSDLFDGQSFVLDRVCESARGFALEIKQNGGRICDKGGTWTITCSGESGSVENRTPVWVERCIDERRILEPEGCPLYVPPFGPPVRPEGMAVSVSGFRNSMRLDIISAVKWLGMSYRSELTRKSRVLITDCEESKKVAAALKWGIPVVGIAWLFAVARGGLPDDFGRFIIKSGPAPVVRPVPPAAPSFLSDDDDGFPSEILAQIEARATEDSNPTDAEREKGEPVILTSLVAGSPRPAARPSPRTNFLSDSSDSDVPDEIGVSVIPDSLEDLSKSIKAYQKPKAARLRKLPPQSSFDMLGTFTQRPVDSDDPALVVGYEQESGRNPSSDVRDDPFLELVKHSESP
jgi:hypothetical protein